VVSLQINNLQLTNKPLSPQRINEAMKNLGYEQRSTTVNGKKDRCWHGVRIKPEVPESRRMADLKEKLRAC
jgi:hypothetical protein